MHMTNNNFDLGQAYKHARVKPNLTWTKSDPIIRMTRPACNTDTHNIYTQHTHTSMFLLSLCHHGHSIQLQISDASSTSFVHQSSLFHSLQCRRGAFSPYACLKIKHHNSKLVTLSSFLHHQLIDKTVVELMNRSTYSFVLLPTLSACKCNQDYFKI